MTTAPQTSLEKLLARLVDRKPMRSEATLQADVRQLLLEGDLNLDENNLSVDLETQVGDGRRIDIEIGFTAIETKKDLRGAKVLKDAEKQLGGYVRTRSEQVGQRYAGILTDGADWRAYTLTSDDLALVSRFEAKARTAPTDLAALWAPSSRTRTSCSSSTRCWSTPPGPSRTRSSATTSGRSRRPHSSWASSSKRPRSTAWSSPTSSAG